MMENSFEYMKENYRRIQEKISVSAEQAGAAPKDIILLGATKTVEPEKINYAISLGMKAMGENRVQELLDKYDSIDHLHCDCQFIGQLQTNKIKYLTNKVSQIQSIDRISQIQEISKQMKFLQRSMNILIEVNIGKEESKGGVFPEALYEFLDEARTFSNVKVNGLMAIPPICENNTRLQDYFSRMNEYFIDMRAKKMDNMSMSILSMGMSCDFAEAIACGANMVRIGSLLFGKRIY